MRMSKSTAISSIWSTICQQDKSPRHIRVTNYIPYGSLLLCQEDCQILIVLPSFFVIITIMTNESLQTKVDKSTTSQD